MAREDWKKEKYGFHKGKDNRPAEDRRNRENRENRKREGFKEREETPVSDEIVVGRNAVMEVLKSGRAVNKLLIAKGERQGSINDIMTLAREKGILWQEVDSKKINDLAGSMRHQGVLAYTAPVEYVEVDDILQQAAAKNEPPFIVLLDELEDPHNLGAILRTADAAGVHGVLIPKRRSCPLSATVAKTSAGAVEYVPVARIGNIAQTLKKLQKQGLWVIGADMDGEKDYNEADLTGPMVLVVGSEGKGMGRLVRESCDMLVNIPMCGKINSLNASVAASILLYESFTQRRKK